MRFYLNCPFNEKEEAKSYGAKWDKEAKKWYYIADMPDSRFNKWQDPIPEPPDTSGYFFHNEQVNIYSEEELKRYSEYVACMRMLYMKAPQDDKNLSDDTKEAVQFMNSCEQFETDYEHFLYDQNGFEGIPATYQNAKTNIPCIDNLKYKDDIRFCFGSEGNQFTDFKFCAASYAKNGDLFINAIGFIRLENSNDPKNVSSLVATQAGSRLAFVMGYQGEQLGLLADAKINLRDLQEIENLSFDKGREQPKAIER